MVLSIWLRLACWYSNDRSWIIKTDFGSGAAGSALEGGELTFPICPACGASGSEAAIDCLKLRPTTLHRF